ncbi:hypothetical protein BJG93_26975 [Paraburkholderia sprentiae WSM5005]|uniref:Uncharacterized protein n=1 Tax=Paraburkholderia sprentiae WSM5005 TaxID=754502 RepID=A0A1I9YRV5_9BURK|nr:hypothetical protein [Paraburkholderia sprentiae]APA88924.1 hypothetical protein BJG93_26975 [Paraburkholderia sprentiae WSM5005]
MYERMRSAEAIIAEMKAHFADMFEGSDDWECLDCRITFKIYKEWPDMPQAMTMNPKSGEWIRIDAIKTLPSGYDMRQALGEGEGCLCRNRPAGPFDERFLVKDEEGSPVTNVRYRIFANGKQIIAGVTDSDGWTERVVTPGLKFVELKVES